MAGGNNVKKAADVNNENKLKNTKGASGKAKTSAKLSLLALICCVCVNRIFEKIKTKTEKVRK